MERRIEKLVEHIRENAGDSPLVFLDTGAVIDFERELEFWRLKSHTYDSYVWYSRLSRAGPIFVTEGVLKEIIRHHEYHLVNGKPEISKDTLEITEKFHEYYCEFLKDISANPKNFDQVRYDAYWACHFSFKDDLKKGYLDIMSHTDREIASTAAWLRYAIDGSGKPISHSIILSPDRHLNHTVRTLTGHNTDIHKYMTDFNYEGIKVLTSRFAGKF